MLWSSWYWCTIQFSVDHFSIFSKSLARALIKEVILFQFALKDRVVSSACISMVELFKCKGISFTNRRYKKGARIDRRSTPFLTGFSWDGIILCPSFTNCHHPSRYNWNQATLSGLTPYTDNFFNNRLWSSMSKALWKSTNTSSVSSSLSILKKILSASLIVQFQWNYQNGRLILIIVLLKIF